MAKTLNQFLEGYLKVKNPDEQKFVDKHVVAKHADRNGNDDEVFKGSKVKMADRRKDRHGYNPGEDEKVYESISESTYEFDVSGEHGNAAVDRLVKHANSKGIKAKVHTYNGPGGGNPVIHLSHKDPKVVHSYAKKHIDPDVDLSHHKINEALKGNQHKIDANKNGKVDAHDFHLLRKKKKVAEEAEQIDELSKNTLHSYIEKSAQDVHNQAYRAGKKEGGEGKVSRRVAIQDLQRRFAIAKANPKSTPEQLAQYQKKIDDMQALKGKWLEEEQLDELSKNTLHSYIEKSAQDVHNQAYRAGKKEGGEGKYDSGKILKSLTRQIGISKATRKLAGKAKVNANEEVEQVDEVLTAKTPMGTYIKDFQKSDAPQFKGKSKEKRRVMAIAAKLSAERGGKPLRKEERLADLLGDLTESHRRTMLSVFDKLNEDNQKKFLEACGTPEGVEQMLDFSISHRGE